MKAAIIVIFLSGCASTPTCVQMTDAERAACEQHTCSVWTLVELRRLIGIALKQGYDAGRKSL
jgi:hypothetical protein